MHQTADTVIVDQLRDAARSQRPVRIDRGRGRWQLEPIYGFVVGVSGRWVAAQRLVDSVYTDGYEVFRTGDVTGVRDDGEGGYVERGVAAVGRPEADFSLPKDATTSEVLRAAADHSPMVCVHLEMEWDDPLLVGRIVGLGARKYDIRLINPRGVWDPEPSRWWYGDVTRIGFGDRYSTTLQRFGDEYPEAAGSRS